MNLIKLVTPFLKYMYTYACYCTVIARITHLSILLNTADLNAIFRKQQQGNSRKKYINSYGSNPEQVKPGLPRLLL